MSAEAGGTSAADAGPTSTTDLERMMEELGLQEDDMYDVVVDEFAVPKEAARWRAVARVHIDKPYSQVWFFRNMRSAWDLAQPVNFRPLEANLYTLQFSCLGDWERAMQEGPWNFRGHAVVITPYDGITQPTKVKLDTIDIWIQVHDVPELYAHLVPSLAAKVGEVLHVERSSYDFVGNFFRVWVKINVYNPLKNAVSLIRNKERQIYMAKYERLLDWCAV